MSSQPAAETWFPQWSGQLVAIVASGPSVKELDLSVLRGRCRVIAINTSYKLVPFADVLYACDFNWWRSYLPKFDGLKVCASDGVDKHVQDVHRVTIRKNGTQYANEIITAPKGTIGGGWNSGFQALNLAVQFGANRVLLIGYDYKVGRDGATHWHGRHKDALSNPNAPRMKQWAEALDKQAPTLARLGVDVVNASTDSALAAYPKLSISQAFDRWSCPPPSS